MTNCASTVELARDASTDAETTNAWTSLVLRIMTGILVPGECASLCVVPSQKMFWKMHTHVCLNSSFGRNKEKRHDNGELFLSFRDCVLECSKSDEECPPGARYADTLTFRMVPLPNGIPAFHDLILLAVFDQYRVHLPQTTFTIIENDDQVPFSIRLEDGKGVLYTLRPLEEKSSYKIKVRAKSYDNGRKDVQYQTTFIIFISVSAYPY